MAAEGIETESAERTGVDWKQIWFDMDTAPDDGFSSSQLCNLVMLHTDVPDLETAGTKVQRARELDEIEHDGSQYVLDASAATDSADDGGEGESVAETGVEAETDEEPDATNDQPAGPSTSTQAADDTPDKVDLLEQRVDAMGRAIDTLEDENQILKAALVELTGEDRAVFDELPELMNTRSKEISRMSRTISKVSNQLDGIGQAKGKNRRIPKEDRILAIQKGLVKENVKAGSRRWRDVDIMRFLDGQGVDLTQSTCSNYLNDAAEAHEAFSKEKNREGRKVLAVDMDKIDEASVLRPKNNGGSEGA